MPHNKETQYSILPAGLTPGRDLKTLMAATCKLTTM